MVILICGLGSIGVRHYNILKKLKPDIEFVALRSRTTKPSNFEDEVHEVYQMEDAMDLSLDGIIISNPTALHVPVAKAFVKKGTPIFIEKPVSHNLVGTDTLIQESKRYRTPVLVGNNLMFHPAIGKLQTLMDKGTVGRIICARTQFGTHMPSWHPWEDYMDSYASRKELGGGVILTSIHELNYLTAFFGQVQSHEAMEIDGNVLGIEVEEGAEILLKHKTGIVSSIHLNFFQIPNHRYCEIMGTEGTLYWDFWKQDIEIRTREGTEMVNLGKDALQLLQHSYVDQMKHFLDIIEKGIAPIVSLEKGAQDLMTSLAILKKLEKRKEN